MSIKQFVAFAVLAAGAYAVPQSASASQAGSATASTDGSPSQTSQFRAALEQYLQSFTESPQYTQVGLDLALQPGGASIISEIKADPSMLLPITASDVDLESLATAPPLSFSSFSWYASLDPAVVSTIQALQTSAVLAIASIDQSILGTEVKINTPTATATSSSSSSGGAGAAMAKPTGVMAVGAAVGALGAAVAML